MEMISPCMFCGCGCRLKYQGNGDLKIFPYDFICYKATKIPEILLSKDRLREVLFREKKNKDFDTVSYDYAVEYLKDIKERFDSKEMIFVASGEITNEDNYLFGRMAREFFGSENIDSCARVCHAPTLKALKETFGIGVSTGKMEEIEDLDLLLLIGTDPYTSYPKAFYHMLNMKRRGGKLAIVSHYYNRTWKYSDIRMLVRPGTEILLILSLIKELIRRGYRSYLDGFEYVLSILKDFDTKRALEEAGVDYGSFRELLDAIDSSKKFGVMNGMGVTQTPFGTDTVRSLLWLVLLKDGGVFTLRGKVNIQGVGSLGLESGIPMTEFFLKGEEFAWILQSNPAVSLPNLGRVWENMRRMFIVYHNPFPSETMDFTNIVFPSLLLPEREGTIVAGDGRVLKVNRVRRFDGVLQDWEVFNMVGGFGYKNVYEIFLEVSKILGVGREVWDGEIGWVRKKPVFKRFPEIKKIPEKIPEGIYLVTIRSPKRWVSGDISDRSEDLRERDNLIAYISRDLSEELNIPDGSLVEIYNEYGSVRAIVKVVEWSVGRTVNVEWHKSVINKLTPPDLEEDTKIPNYKMIRINIRVIS